MPKILLSHVLGCHFLINNCKPHLTVRFGVMLLRLFFGGGGVVNILIRQLNLLLHLHPKKTNKQRNIQLIGNIIFFKLPRTEMEYKAISYCSLFWNEMELLQLYRSHRWTRHCYTQANSGSLFYNYKAVCSVQPSGYR
jgi:hypothetical protein